MALKIERTGDSCPPPFTSPDELGFGRIFSPHMFQMRFGPGRGWHDPEILPYQDLSLPPATSFIHYGVSIFEGLKAYRGTDDGIFLFRPDKYLARMNASARRLCMPEIDEDFVTDAITQLVRLDQAWVPRWPGTALYIRPTMFADEPALGIHVSPTYFFFIITSPVGAYSTGAFTPIKIWVEREYVRSVRGGTGYSKCSGNYAGSLIAARTAQERGYSQVLWLDGVEHEYVEEVGMMNIFFVIDGEVLTPNLAGSILAGVTRDSILDLCNRRNLTVRERKISISEIIESLEEGRCTEVFGTGTAAVISPVSYLAYENHEYRVGDGKPGPLTRELYAELQWIQYGAREGPPGWSHRVI